MGTLFHQLPYQEKITKGNLKSLISDIKDVQKDTGLEFYEVIQAYELQLKITKADTLDEQLAGFGKILDRLSDSHERFSESMGTFSYHLDNGYGVNSKEFDIVLKKVMEDFDYTMMSFADKLKDEEW